MFRLISSLIGLVILIALGTTAWLFRTQIAHKIDELIATASHWGIMMWSGIGFSGIIIGLLVILFIADGGKVE